MSYLSFMYLKLMYMYSVWLSSYDFLNVKIINLSCYTFQRYKCTYKFSMCVT